MIALTRVNDSSPLPSITPFKWHWIIQADTDKGGWRDGRGTTSFHAPNVRQDLIVAYLRFNTDRANWLEKPETTFTSTYADYDVLYSVRLAAPRSLLDAPHNIRLALTSAQPVNITASVSVVELTWHTARAQAGWSVLYSTNQWCLNAALQGSRNPRNCRSTAVTRRDVAAPVTWTGSAFCNTPAGQQSTAQGPTYGFIPPGYQHSVVLDGVAPGQEYYYAIKGPNSVVSEVFSFKTPPRPGGWPHNDDNWQPTRLLLAADVGTNNGKDRSNSVESYTWTVLNYAGLMLGCLGPTKNVPPYPGFSMSQVWAFEMPASSSSASAGAQAAAANQSTSLAVTWLGEAIAELMPLLSHSDSVTVGRRPSPVGRHLKFSFNPGALFETCANTILANVSFNLADMLPGTPPLPMGNMLMAAQVFAGSPMGGHQAGTIATHSHLNDLASTGRYHASLVVGDVSYAQGYAYKWDTFFQQLAPMYQRAPGIFGAGNHESHDVGVPNALFTPSDAGAGALFETDAGGECGVAYNKWTRMPGQLGTWNGKQGEIIGQWHAETVGHVRVININTDQEWAPGSLQYQWLETQLKASIAARSSREYTWLIVAYHRPMYIDDPDASPNGNVDIGIKMQAALEPLFSKYQVDLTLAGHTHYYVATYPMAKFRVVPAGSKVHGITHIVLGNGGFQNPPLLTATKPDWIRCEHMEFGICDLSATRTRLRLQCFNSTSPQRQVLDTVELNKAEGWVPRSTSQTAAAYAAWQAGSPPSDTLHYGELFATLTSLVSDPANRKLFQFGFGEAVGQFLATTGELPFTWLDQQFAKGPAGRLLEAAPGTYFWDMRQVWTATQPLIKLLDLLIKPTFQTTYFAGNPDAAKAVSLIDWLATINKEGSGRVWRLAFKATNDVGLGGNFGIGKGL